ncbi:hypothetical protein P152DRAFT_460234 [Eremomyces bilateralis CBS 781.70]|uniref:ABM domain-containing protein n=1 Tax=Eremomyces bilateralis CBS 781.70 TaxID=1392243 RepID=A0A6G1FXL9_9PEZI|nr:uncharacterized protein P152DRAFT_460234 [Eremomyces bilateralis CBS 781.70]KAF1810533.1 hypothetical protein P152DRAFT_460234 [Eremomyces bilateralis CBS 781.70]
MAVWSQYVVVVFETRSTEYRDAVIDLLAKIVSNTKATEPGALKYCVAVPRDPSDDRKIYCIEEYASQAANDIHMASAPVQALFKYLSETPTALAGAPTVMTMSPLAAFTRPEIASYNDPAISFIELGSGKDVDMIAVAAQQVAIESRGDPRLLCTAALRDINKPVVRLFRVGRKGDGSEESDGSNVPLRAVSGYLWKDTAQEQQLW